MSLRKATLAAISLRTKLNVLEIVFTVIFLTLFYGYDQSQSADVKELSRQGNTSPSKKLIIGHLGAFFKRRELRLAQSLSSRRLLSIP